MMAAIILVNQQDDMCQDDGEQGSMLCLTRL